MKPIGFTALLILLAACDQGDEPQAPTAQESDRLNEADSMLNELANEEGAAPTGTAPSNQSD